MKINKSKNKINKISEAFLEYSFPLLDELGPNATKEQVEKVLQITYTVWNAVVMDMANNNSEYVSLLRKSMKKDPITISIIEQFIERKNDLFSDDLRVIGNYSVKETNNEWRLRAEARRLPKKHT
jgi:hypothetical protein